MCGQPFQYGNKLYEQRDCRRYHSIIALLFCFFMTLTCLVESVNPIASDWIKKHSFFNPLLKANIYIPNLNTSDDKKGIERVNKKPS